MRGHTGQVLHEVVKRRGVELGKRVPGQYQDRHRYVLEVLFASVGSDNHLLQLISGGDLRRRFPRRRNFRDENADAARRKVLDLESGALEHSSQRLTSAESRRNRVRSLVTHVAGDIEELQSGLAAERCQRLRERLRGNVGGEHFGLKRLSQQRRGLKHRNGRADR